MSMRCYRFFGGLIASQEDWLNRMAARGRRLVRTGKLLYEFEACAPGKYCYRVEFAGEKSRESARDYAGFLRECGYRVFFKNINLNWSAGKAVLRPWAEPGGRISTNRTTYGRELLIVEKESDGAPFELHTTFADRLACAKAQRRPWLWLLLASAALGVCMRSWIWGILAALALAVVIAFQLELRKLSARAEIEE